VPPKQTPAAIKTLTPTIIGQNWEQTVGATNNSEALENLSIAEWAYASGLTKSMVRGHAKRALVLIASAHGTLKPQHSGKLTLHLSRKARKRRPGWRSRSAARLWPPVLVAPGQKAAGLGPAPESHEHDKCDEQKHHEQRLHRAPLPWLSRSQASVGIATRL
jgi:hypothetical protein